MAICSPGILPVDDIETLFAFRSSCCRAAGDVKNDASDQRRRAGASEGRCISSTWREAGSSINKPCCRRWMMASSLAPRLDVTIRSRRRTAT